jgi:hypothetical protein
MENPGDLLVAAVYWSFADGGAVSVSDTNGNGWTALMAEANGSTKAQLWYAPNVLGGSDMVTISASSGADLGAVVLEYSGIATTSPLDTNAGGSAGFVTANMDTGPFSTSSANELIVALFVDADLQDGETMTAGTGFSKEALDTGFVAMVEDNPPYLGPAGTQNATATLATGDMAWMSAAAAFRAK